MPSCILGKIPTGATEIGEGGLSGEGSTSPGGVMQVLKEQGVCAQLLSHVLPSATLWTVAHQAPLSMGFSR